MRKFSISLLIGFSLITLTGSVFAQSTNPLPWKEAAAQRNGDYNKFVASIDYSNVVKPNNNPTPLLPWEETAAQKNGYYNKFVASIDYSNVVKPNNNPNPLLLWEETAAQRNGDYSKVIRK